jgi:hypothetical protein
MCTVRGYTDHKSVLSVESTQATALVSVQECFLRWPALTRQRGTGRQIPSAWHDHDRMILVSLHMWVKRRRPGRL